QFSVEDERWGNGRGLFSYYLVNGLRGLADENENLYVSKFEIENYLRDNVRRESDLKQIPVISGGLSSLRLSRVDSKLLQQFQDEPIAPVASNSAPSNVDTSALSKFTQFEKALSQKQLLYPKAGSAYEIYQSMGKDAQSQAFKKIMKISLTSALQDEAQQALNEYITSPGRELAKRWTNAEAYANYPAYLDVAADLLGADNYFYKDVKSRAHYFRGVNQRLVAQAEDMQDTDFYLAAMTEQQKALQLQPIAPHIYNEMGLLYQQLKNSSKATENFQKAIALSPTWGLALTNLAIVYQQLEQYELAERYFLESIQADENLSLSYFNLGYFYEEIGKEEQAEQAYATAIQRKDPDPDAYYNLAYIKMTKQPAQDQAALDLLNQYRALVPEDVDAYGLIARLYVKEGRLDDAIDLLRAALKIQPNDRYILNYLANCLQDFSDLDGAIDIREHLITVEDVRANDFLNLASMYLLKNNQKLAIETLDQLLQTGYDDYTFLTTWEAFKSLQSNPLFQALLKKYFPDR
ncbi:MAG: tetratricopeptide repeat protein, partial [Bacteroidota bacterium]